MAADSLDPWVARSSATMVRDTSWFQGISTTYVIFVLTSARKCKCIHNSLRIDSTRQRYVHKRIVWAFYLVSPQQYSICWQDTYFILRLYALRIFFDKCNVYIITCLIGGLMTTQTNHFHLPQQTDETNGWCIHIYVNTHLTHLIEMFVL